MECTRADLIRGGASLHNDNSMKNFKVDPFQKAAFSQGLVVAARRRIVEVKHPAMIDVIDWLSCIPGQSLKADQLSQRLEGTEVTYEDAVTYLTEDLGVLQTARAHEGAIEQLICYTDNEIFFRLADRHFKNYALPVAFSYITDVTKFEASKEYDDRTALIVDFSTDYTPQRVRKIYQTRMSQPNTIFLTSFFLGDACYIDNLHSPQLATPCHYCTLSQLNRNRYKEQYGTDYSWAYMYDFILKNDLSIFPRTSILEIDVCHAGAVLLKKIDALLLRNEPMLPQRDDQLITAISSSTGLVTRDQSVHWGFCDCLHS